MLVHYTDCGMLTFSDDEIRRQGVAGDGHQARMGCRGRRSTIEKKTSASRSRGSGEPLHPEQVRVRGFVYEVETRPAARSHVAASGERPTS
jgi:hypothetical protein